MTTYSQPTTLWRLRHADGRQAHALIVPRWSDASAVWSSMIDLRLPTTLRRGRRRWNGEKRFEHLSCRKVGKPAKRRRNEITSHVYSGDAVGPCEPAVGAGCTANGEPGQAVCWFDGYSVREGDVATICEFLARPADLPQSRQGVSESGVYDPDLGQ